MSMYIDASMQKCHFPYKRCLLWHCIQLSAAFSEFLRGCFLKGSPHSHSWLHVHLCSWSVCCFWVRVACKRGCMWFPVQEPQNVTPLPITFYELRLNIISMGCIKLDAKQFSSLRATLIYCTRLQMGCH